MNIGENILSLRKEKKMSQDELATKLNVTRQTISNWESNETSPDLKQSKELSKIFNITLDELANNKIEKIVYKRLSNVEKLSKILIKLLRVFIVGLVIFALFFALDLMDKLSPWFHELSISKKVEKNEVVTCVLEGNIYNFGFLIDKNDKTIGAYGFDGKVRPTVIYDDKGNLKDSKIIKNDIYSFFEALGGKCTERTN